MLFDDYGDLLNLNDICMILYIRSATAAKLCRSGRLKAFKAGREWRITRWLWKATFSLKAIIPLTPDISPQA